MLRRLLIICAAIVLVAALLTSLGMGVRRELGWIDAVTASTKHRTEWILGIETEPFVVPSSLEQWLVAREGDIRHDWRNVQDTSMTIWGRPMEFAHGLAPPIYPLRGDILDRFVRESSDEELIRFVETMRHGTEEEQLLAVDAAIATVFATMEQDTQ